MSRMQLLVVDDEPDVCEFIGDVAEELGFDAALTHDPEEFRTTYHAVDPSVIVLDLIMPGTDGVELLRYLAERNCKAQIILVSGLDAKVLRTAQRLGASHDLNMAGILQKPIAVPELEAVLSNTMPHQPAFTETDLRRAIESDELVLHYQPKVDLLTERIWSIASVEALVRWNHPEHGLLMPDAFIPLAQDSGLLGPLTDFVVRSTAEQVRLWHEHGLELVASVNLPPQLFGDLELPDRFSDIMNEFGLDNASLMLEVTEAGAMADTSLTLDILTRFRVKGFQLSMDDFGTGYSSLIQLYRMPFTEMKIDKSFVIDANWNEEAETIVRSIVALAHGLGLKVCAEGVETEAALDLLRSVQCETAQGYFISKPVPATELPAFVQQYRGETSGSLMVASG